MLCQQEQARIQLRIVRALSAAQAMRFIAWGGAGGREGLTPSSTRFRAGALGPRMPEPSLCGIQKDVSSGGRLKALFNPSPSACL